MHDDGVWNFCSDTIDYRYQARLVNVKGKGISSNLTKGFKQELKKHWKIALYQSQREIHTVAARSAPGDLGLKSLSTHIDILIRSPIQEQTEADAT